MTGSAVKCFEHERSGPLCWRCPRIREDIGEVQEGRVPDRAWREAGGFMVFFLFSSFRALGKYMKKVIENDVQKVAPGSRNGVKM